MTLDRKSEPLGSAYLVTDHELGRGAMGRVYVGLRKDTGEAVAVKMLRPELADDPEIVSRFLQERSVLTGIDDPNLVRVHDLVLESGRAAVVMDLVSGADLRKYLTERRIVSQPEALSIVEEILAALTVIHAKGIVHRDVKPENVLLDSEGHAHLSDFGIAKITTSQSMTRLTGLIGTPEYIAPEAVESSGGGPPIDVYSTGIMLYELMAGQTPFVGGHPVAVLRRHLDDLPSRPTYISDEVWALVSAMLAKTPEERPTASQARETCLAIEPGSQTAAVREIARGVKVVTDSMSGRESAIMQTIASSRLTLGASSLAKLPPDVLQSGAGAQTIVSPRSAEGVSKATEPLLASPKQVAISRSGSKRRRRALIIASLAVVLIVAGVAVATSFGAKKHASADAVVPTKSILTTLTNGWAEKEQLTLGGTGGRQLSGSVVMQNSSGSGAQVQEYLVIPPSFAPLASQVKVSPTAAIILSDPVFAWKPTIGFGHTWTFTFQLRTPEYRTSAANELSLFAKSQDAAALAFTRSPRGRHLHVPRTLFLVVRRVSSSGSGGHKKGGTTTTTVAAPVGPTINVQLVTTKNPNSPTLAIVVSATGGSSSLTSVSCNDGTHTYNFPATGMTLHSTKSNLVYRNGERVIVTCTALNTRGQSRTSPSETAIIGNPSPPRINVIASAIYWQVSLHVTAKSYGSTNLRSVICSATGQSPASLHPSGNSLPNGTVGFNYGQSENVGGTCTATDSLGQFTSLAWSSSTTAPGGPSVSVTVTGVSYRNVSVSVSSFATSPATITSVSCTWGDGNGFTVSGGVNQTASHLYGSDGNPTISCTVTDSYYQQGVGSRQVSEQAQHAVTLWNNWNLSGGAVTLCSSGCSTQGSFTIGAGVTQLTEIKVGSDIWPTYEPSGEVLTLGIYVNGNLAYQGTQGQHYGGSNQQFQFNFNVGVSQGSSVTIKVTFSGVSKKISDIFPMGNPSNSYCSNFSGTIFAGELYGLS